MKQRAPGTDVLLVEDLGQQRLPARSLAALLRQAGLSARLAHFGPGDDPGGLITLARREEPRLIVLSILFAHLVAQNLLLAASLRAAGVAAHLTMTGPLPTFAWAELLAACSALDSVLRGEAEASLVQLAAALCDGVDWRDVPGLAYRYPVPCANPLPRPACDLDDLPFPARDEGMPTRLGLGFATLEASRGCYHACTFCLPCVFYRAGGAPAYRLRGIPNLAAEIDALYRRGARLFLFDDEQFLPPGRLRGERVRTLADELERRGLDIAFTIKCRADDVDEALFRQLKAMGLIRVYLGVESGCQESLDLLAKGVSVECNARALALLDELEMVADFRCLLFHPWSTLETLRADLEFLEHVLPYVSTPFAFHEVECYPGTPLAELLRAGECGPADRRWAREPLDRDFRLAYTIADPRTEVLRRLSRLLFGARNAEGGIHGRISQAWYDILLARRFWPGVSSVDLAGALRQGVARLNRESLAIWREMLSFVAQGDVYAASRVNARASDWAARINAIDMSTEGVLAGLQSSLEPGPNHDHVRHTSDWRSRLPRGGHAP
jgi:anaerobic magnesium-protoporphyrin IX monomethyl ester cyclase